MDDRTPKSLGDMPEPVLASRRGGGGFSLIWLAPIIAVLIGGWLVYKTISERGPTIRISFDVAEGLEAGKTKIKYRDVEVGRVSAISIADDRSRVHITAAIDKPASDYLRDTTRFWVVRPRLGATGVSGLGTLISGAYIEIDPGTGKTKHEFMGLEEPPVIRADAPGGKYVLHAANIGSIGPRTPIFHRGLRVGEVLGHELDKDGNGFRIFAFVKDPFHKLVQERSNFWNLSGIEIDAGAEGFKIRMHSLEALLAGGIEFDAPDDPAAARLAAADHRFALHASKEAVREAAITEQIPYLIYFDGSVKGLAVGAAVEFRGVRVGSVREIVPEMDLRKNNLRIAVIIMIEPERLSGARVTGQRGERYAALGAMVERGLRAQMVTANLLTGQKLVSLDFFPDRPPETLDRSGRYPEIPSIPSPVTEIVDAATRVLQKIEELPIDVLIGDVRKTLGTLDRTLIEARETLGEAKGLVASTRRDVAPIFADVRRALDQANKTLASVEQITGSESEVRRSLTIMLQELAEASRSIRLLTEYLERHPEALVSGKGGR